MRAWRWPALGAFVAVNGALAATGHGALLTRVFPVTALLVGLVLYRADRALFVGFCWWLWLVGPAVRRIADLSAGWNEMNPIAVTPLLVSALALHRVVKRLPNLGRRVLVPFAVAMAAIGFGLLVGVARAGVVPAAYAAASWMIPVVFGCYLAMHAEWYPQMRRMLVLTFAVALPLLGAYAVLQFVRPPAWDVYWMTHVDMYSIGVPLPYRVRVFATLNAPAPFASVIAAGVFLVLAARPPARLAALGGGAVSLLLSLVRGAWLGTFVGAAVYVVAMPARARRRLLLGMAVVGAASVIAVGSLPARSGGPFATVVSRRLATLGDLRADRSFKVRMRALGEYGESILVTPEGRGLGTTGVAVALNRGRGVINFDNGALETLYTLGWAAGAGYLLAVAALLLGPVRAVAAARDRFVPAVHAAAVAVAVQAIATNVFASVSGMALWTCLGLLVAAARWHSRAERIGAAVAAQRALLAAEYEHA